MTITALGPVAERATVAKAVTEESVEGLAAPQRDHCRMCKIWEQRLVGMRTLGKKENNDRATVSYVHEMIRFMATFD